MRHDHGIDFARPERKHTMVEPFQATRTLKQPTVDQKPTLAIRDFHTRTGHCAPSAMKCERNRLFRVHHRPSIEYQRDGASAPLAPSRDLRQRRQQGALALPIPRIRPMVPRPEEHTSALQSPTPLSYAV